MYTKGFHYGPLQRLHHLSTGQGLPEGPWKLEETTSSVRSDPDSEPDPEALREEDGLSAGDIGKRLVLDNATLSGVLDRLAERGWIEKQTDLHDKRLLRIHLTDKAKAVQGELGEERDQANEEILHALSVEEKVLLKRLLRDVQT